MSFYEKLSMKLQGEGPATTAKDPSPGAKPVSYNATGVKTPPVAQQNAAPAAPTLSAPAADATPDGMDPLMIDLLQTDTRMIVTAQAGGVAAEDFEVTADEESNTLLIQAVQKRPATPSVPGAAQDAAAEKGRFIKQEVKWVSLYRKVYLPEPFDSGTAQTILEHGVLTVVLPIRRPGEGKKLPVRDQTKEESKK